MERDYGKMVKAKMLISMKESLRMIKNVDLEFSSGSLEIYIKGSIIMK
jgi:hypothetical protein